MKGFENMKYKIATIIVTYNRLDLLKECIQAVINQDIYNYDLDIYIIDNNSSDGTEEYIKNLKYDNVYYSNTGKNLGGAGGFNYGIKFAMKKEYDYLWIMDDDTIPNKDALYELMKIVDKKIEFGFLASYVYWTDNTTCNMNKSNINISKIWNKMDVFTDNIILPCDSTSFVSCLIPTKCIYSYGLPISDFIIWCDDVEYTGRIAKNLDGYYVPRSKVLHKMKNNNPALIYLDDVSRLDRYKLKYRNQHYIAKRDKKLKKYYFNVLRDIKLIIVKSKSHKIKRINSVVTGVIKGIAFRPKVEFLNKD